MINQLREILVGLHEQEGNDFSGLGVVVYHSLDNVPMHSLYKDKAIISGDNLQTKLKIVSDTSSKYHDGFHFISSTFELTHVSQYFYPPIPNNFIREPQGKKGVRNLVAQAGSLLTGILLTGVVSSDCGVDIFENGKLAK